LNDRASSVTKEDGMTTSDNDAERDSHIEEAEALVDKGAAFESQSRSAEAIAAYDEVGRRFGEDPDPGLRMEAAGALFRKGSALGLLGQSEEAIAAYDEIVRRFGKDPFPGLRMEAARALVKKGVKLQVQSRSAEAIAAYDEVGRRFGEDPDPGLRMEAVGALFRKATKLRNLGRSAEAIAAYEEVVRHFSDDLDPVLYIMAAGAEKDSVLGLLRRSAEAIATYDEIAHRFSDDPDQAARGVCAAEALINKSATLDELGRSETPDEGVRGHLLRAESRAAKEWLEDHSRLEENGWSFDQWLARRRNLALSRIDDEIRDLKSAEFAACVAGALIATGLIVLIDGESRSAGWMLLIGLPVAFFVLFVVIRTLALCLVPITKRILDRSERRRTEEAQLPPPGRWELHRKLRDFWRYDLH
jgi:tetratricopeptide (TPR) repeat protein